MTVRTEHFYGLGIARNAGTPNSQIDISPGGTMSSTWMQRMVLPATLTKLLSATFAAGSGAGGLDVGTSAINSTYHIHLIEKTSDGTIDALLSLSHGRSATVTITSASPGVITYTGHGLQANAPFKLSTTGALWTGLAAGTQYYVKTVLNNDTFTLSATQGGAAINTSGSQSGTHTLTAAPVMPAGYGERAYLWPIMTDGSGNIRAFLQLGNTFHWDVPTNDQTLTSPAAAVAVSVPTGVKTLAMLTVGVSHNTTGDTRGVVCSPDITAPVLGVANYNIGHSNAASGEQEWKDITDIPTNTQKQVYVAVPSGANVWLTARGYRFPREAY